MHRKLSFFSLCLAVLLTVAAHADTCNGFSNNLVANCSFETGSFSNWGGTSTTDVYSDVDSFAPYAGVYDAYLASEQGTATLTQTLSTVAGTTYLIEFALMNDTNPSTGYTNSFVAQFGGATLLSETAVAMGAYTLYSSTAAATLAATPLTFTSRNDAGGFYLDSVSVTAATPEPSTWLLLATGMAGGVGVARRRLFRRT